MKRQPLLIVLLTCAALLVAVAAPADAGRPTAQSRAWGGFFPPKLTLFPTTTARPATTTTTTSTSTTVTTSTTTTTSTTAPTTTAPTSQVAGPPPLAVATRRLTKLRFTIDSTSDWANIDLLGGSLYSQGTPSVLGGSGYPYSTTGFAVQTPGYVRMVVDVVYDLPNGNLDLRVCKNSEGITTVRVERITDVPTTVALVTNSRVDGFWEGGCADPSHTAVTANALAPPYSWPRPRDDRRLTLAIFTPWYEPASFQQSQFVDTPVEPYNGTTQAGVTGMVNQAADAGVNGFVYWYNGAADAERRYDLVMRAAESRPGFTVAAQLDLGAAGGFATGGTTQQTIEAWTRVLLARSSSPSYLKVGGRPVLFVWGTPYMSPAAWQQTRVALQASGLNPFVVGDTLNSAFGFDGFWVLNPNNVPDSSTLPAWFEYWSRTVRVTPEHSLGSAPLLWAAGISPGEDDTYSGKPPGWGLLISREGGARYDKVWQAAAASSPEWMVISSWNDFHEATYVQPSVALGTQALDQTRAWAGWFSKQ